MSITIDKDEALALLNRAVEEKGPDYQYVPPMLTKTLLDGNPWSFQSCVYVADGAPSCIVGHALAYAGVPVEEIAKLDTADEIWNETHEGQGNYIGGTGIDTLGRYGVTDEYIGVTLTPDARNILAVAQVEQDQGKPWGEAVQAAADRGLALTR